MSWRGFIHLVREVPIIPAFCRRSIHLTCIRCEAKSIREMQRQQKDSFSGRGYILLILPATALCLGTWQVQRRKWKLGLIEELDRRTRAQPIPLSAKIEELEDLEYRKVEVRGKYDHAGELYMMPRSLIEDGDVPSGGLVGTQGQSGAHVITPFILSDSGKRILVNRGWVSRDKINPKNREVGQVSDEVTIVGVVRHDEKRPQFGAENDIRRNEWYNRDLDAMSQLRRTEKIFLDADIRSSNVGGPIGGQTRVTLRNEHLSYIFTWYSLSAITFAMWYRRYWLRRL